MKIYNVLFHPKALVEFTALDGRLTKLVAKQVKKISLSPELGQKLGNKAGCDLNGYRKMYTDSKRIRIVYQIIEEKI